MNKPIVKFPAYTLLERDDDSETLVVELCLPPELIFFQGHFPEKAILPAVSQIYVAEQIFKHYFPGQLTFLALKRLKFRQPIVPTRQIQLELKFDTEKSLLSFRYFDHQTLKSSGHILFSQP